MSQENVEILRRGYEAFARDDFDGIMPLLDEQIEWRNPEESPIAGVFHGHQGVMDWLTQVRESFADMRFMPDEFKELPDGRVLVLVRFAFRPTQTGVPMEFPMAHLIAIRDGLITYLKMYSDQQQALKAVGLEA